MRAFLVLPAMSDQENDVASEEEEPPFVAWVREHFEGVTLAGLATFMLWVRMRSYDNFVQNGEVLFSGNDPWYHLRQVSYTVRHWPATMPYDPWTYYPFGTNSNQFGTLYDQLVATAALVVGLGDPSQQLVAKTLLVSPAVLGALLVVPAYFAGRRLGGVYGGLFGAAVLALLPATTSGILSRTLVGSADHQAIEALLQMVAVVAFLVALGVAKEEKPVYELVVDRDFDALRRPVGWAALAGVTVGLYVWTWPPAVLLIGVAGIFFAIKISADYYHGRSPEPIAFVAVVSMTVAGVLSMLPTNETVFIPTAWSLLQPFAAFAIAGGAAFMAWLAREWDDRELDAELYPLTIGGIAAVGLGALSVVLPGVWSTLVNNFQRIVGFSAGAKTRTISEAQPFLNQVQPGVISAQEVIMLDYGLMFFTAILALFVMLASPLFYSTERADHATLIGGLLVVAAVWELSLGSMVLGVLPIDVAEVLVEETIVGGVVLLAMVRGDHDGEELFVAVWSLFMIAAAFTQVRFNYYLALSVVVLNAYLIGAKFMPYIRIVDETGQFVDEIEPYQMMALMLALLTILPVLIAPIPYFEQQTQQGTQTYRSTTAWDAGNSTGPGNVNVWTETLDWMSNETPEEGNLGGRGNQMKYYGTYQATDDYSYEAGTYGVMSWWDYGHWITVHGERIPNANPFQQGATKAANFLLAPNETRANQVLEEDMEDDETTRYVVIDSQMANPYGKFSAPTVFYDDANVSYTGDFTSRCHYQVRQNGQARCSFRLNKQRYYESMMIRLYRFNGDRVEPDPVVIRWREINGTRLLPQEDRVLKQYRSMRGARQGVWNYTNSTGGNERGVPNATIGGIWGLVREPVPAVKHYRLVRASQRTKVDRPGDRPSFSQPTSRVKVFERVPGANVTGTGPSNATVLASVEVAYGTRNKTFTYTQQAKTGPDGKFEMTLPYSTTGYENYGPENGYTNVSVRATGPYRISTSSITVENGTPYIYSTELNVSEANVIGEDDSTYQVTLERGSLTQNTSNSSSVRAPPAELPDEAAPDHDASAPAVDDGSASQPDVAAVGRPDAGAANRRPVTDGGSPARSMPPGRSALAGGAGAPGDGSPLDSAPVGGLLLFVLLAGVVLAEVRDGRRP
jgi:oligosaccharyl transferase (archaeosortase A-associated)